MTWIDEKIKTLGLSGWQEEEVRTLAFEIVKKVVPLHRQGKCSGYDSCILDSKDNAKQAGIEVKNGML